MSEQHPIPHEEVTADQNSDAPEVLAVGTALDGEYRFPSPEEMEEFESLRTYQRGMLPPGLRAEIETYATDPENPTPEEIRAVATYNRGMGLDGVTFEEHFGYPDPRERAEHPSEIPSSDDQSPRAPR
ncbi:hypothetical protein AB0P21_20775 [Kribbella sp. NPDC056861]|uniref:hypothetical protein n=1 Tax=Kribbella sp. NPDC056861 TaxID=3154857 RepID=UPI00343152E9